ncbi:hypothetical protein GCM10020221_22230 [Streptomyces thioluteus]|uniref:GerMN domain-containing protein n=1 Tax=Streptomyces thioluteus TaxID=66431 RepID=A0ABN3WS53_STRTU
MNNGVRRRRPVTALAAGAVCGGLLAGCASMPDSGEVDSVDSSQRADADAQVRVYGVPPRKNEQPVELVKGFLEATTSDDPDYATARMYLAKNAKRQWQPTVSTTVLSEPIPQVQVEAGGGERGAELTVVLTGKQVAQVDAKHAYRPTPAPTGSGSTSRARTASGASTRCRPGWWWGSPTSSASTGRSTSTTSPNWARGRAGRRGDVPRRRPRLPAQADRHRDLRVKALLDGPTTWLDPVAASAFPAGTRLEDERLSLDDSNSLKVRLSEQAEAAGQDQCLRMAAQLFYTAQESARVDRVTLQSKGETLCSLNRGRSPQLRGRTRPPGGPSGSTSSTSSTGWPGWPTGRTSRSACPDRFGADGGPQLRSVAVDPQGAPCGGRVPERAGAARRGPGDGGVAGRGPADRPRRFEGA